MKKTLHYNRRGLPLFLNSQCNKRSRKLNVFAGDTLNSSQLMKFKLQL